MIKTKKELQAHYVEMSKNINQLRGVALPYFPDRINLSDRQVDLMNEVISGLRKAHEASVWLEVELSKNVKKESK